MASIFMSGCGSDTDDTGRRERLRLLIPTDTFTLINPNITQELYGTKYNYTVKPVSIKTSDDRSIIAELPLIVEVPEPLLKAKGVPPGSYNYYNYVQYVDGSIAEVAGNLSVDGTTLELLYENILCQGELYYNLTWTSEGYTYKVESYEYVKTTVGVLGAFKISCVGNGERKFTWWSTDIGFYVKEVSDLSEKLLYSIYVIEN